MVTDCISFFNKVPYEHFFRSVIQQLLYGLAYNSWLYQGESEHNLCVCAHKYLCEFIRDFLRLITFCFYVKYEYQIRWKKATFTQI